MKRPLMAAGLVVALSVGTWRTFAAGLPVHDNLSYLNALVMLAQIINNYEKLKEQYDLQVWNSTPVPVDMGMEYRVPDAPWYELALPSDRFGRLTTWLQAVNAAGSAWDGYALASTAPRDASGNFSKVAPDEQEKLANRYASIELTDGTNIHSMETLGMLRVNALAADTSLQALEDDALSMAPEMNTELAVLNKINAASIAGLRLSRDTNRLLLSTVEQRIVESKLRRDSEASELNVQMIRLELGDQAKAQHTDTLGESLRSFRWR